MMRKRILSMIFALSLILNGAVTLAEDGAFRVECESVGTSVTASGMSGGAALDLGASGTVTYNIEAAEDGVYAFSLASTLMISESTSEFYITVNGKRVLYPSDASLQSEFTSGSFSEKWGVYTYPDINLKSGQNVIKAYCDTDDTTSAGKPACYLDYFEFEKKTVDFAPDMIITETDCYYSGENIKPMVLFSGYAPKKLQYCYMAQDADGAPIKMGMFDVASGEDCAVLDLTGLPNGWYNLKIYTYNFGSFTGVERHITVSDEVTEETPFATDFAAGTLIAGMDKFKRLEKNLSKAGITNVRDRISIKGRNVKMKNYDSVYKNDGINVTSMYDSTINNSRDFSEDLITIYTKSKEMAEKGASDTAYEIMNEADGGYANSTGDMYASYFKASAIGISDGMSTAPKGIAGLAYEAGMPFTRLLMQNDVLSYSDFYNHHMHTQYAPYAINSLITSNIRSHTEMKNAYSEAMPMWMTEAGFNISDNRMSDEALRAKGRFYITQLAQANSLGTDKVYFFTWPCYREGNTTFGVFDENMMPEAVYSTIAATSGALGKGSYKGILSKLPNGAEGYMYNNGTDDVAVIFSPSNSNWQCYTDSNVTVTDYYGRKKEALKTSHGMVNVAISSEPVFVTFSGESDIRNYYPQNRISNTLTSKEYDDAQRIVIRQLWKGQNLSAAKSKGYIINGEQDIEIEVYNFSDSNCLVDLNFETEGNFTLDKDNVSLVVQSMKKTVYTIKANAVNAIPGETAYVKISGSLGENDISPSVAKMYYDNSNAKKEQTVWLEEANSANNWTTLNHSSAGTVVKTQADNGVTFDYDMTACVGASYAYPTLELSDGSVLKNTDGACFNISFDEDYANAFTDVFVYTSSGAYHIDPSEYIEIKSGTRNIFVRWDELVKYSGSGSLAPEDIQKISVGLQGRGDIPAYTVSELGAFVSDEADNAIGDVVFENLTNGEAICAGKDISVIMPKDEYDNVTVLLNGYKYDLYEKLNGKYIINTDGLERGFYTVQITGIDNMLRADMKSMDFYVD